MTGQSALLGPPTVGDACRQEGEYSVNVMLVVRDLSATPSLRGRIDDVSAEFDRFFHDLRRVSWSLRLEAGRIKASCALSARSGEYRAHASHAAAVGAVDLVYDKLVTQRRRVKMKRVGARRARSSRETNA